PEQVGSPRCGITWSATNAGITRPEARHISQRGCFANWAARSLRQTAVEYSCLTSGAQPSRLGTQPKSRCKSMKLILPNLQTSNRIHWIIAFPLGTPAAIHYSINTGRDGGPSGCG